MLRAGVAPARPGRRLATAPLRAPLRRRGAAPLATAALRAPSVEASAAPLCVGGAGPPRHGRSDAPRGHRVRAGEEPPPRWKTEDEGGRAVVGCSERHSSGRRRRTKDAAARGGGEDDALAICKYVMANAAVHGSRRPVGGDMREWCGPQKAPSRPCPGTAASAP